MTPRFNVSYTFPRPYTAKDFSFIIEEIRTSTLRVEDGVIAMRMIDETIGFECHGKKFTADVFALGSEVSVTIEER